MSQPREEPSAGGFLANEVEMPKKPITADEAMEMAIGEVDQTEYTIDSDNSPYLEVRANVPNTDDPTLPVNTLRMWFLGIVFTLVRTRPLLNSSW